MLKNKVMFLVPGLLLGVSTFAAPKTPAPKVPAGSPDFTVRRDHVGRQEVLRNTDAEVARANRLVVEGKFDEAIELYRAVAKSLENFAGQRFVERRNICEKRIRMSYFKKAEAAMRKADDTVTIGDFEAAIRLCKEALMYCPEKKEELEKKIAMYEIRSKAARTREGRDIANLAPGLEAQNYQIQVLIEQGRALVRRQEYMKAKRKFEEVLLIDPYNDVAMQDLLGVNTMIRNAARLRANATARRFVGGTVWGKAIPVVTDKMSMDSDNQLDSPAVKTVESELEKKLRSIRTTVSFEGKNIYQIMEILSKECLRHDPARLGVNFVIKSKPGITADTEEQPMVDQFFKRNASIYDILFDLQHSKKFLTFRVDRNAVYVAAAGVPLEKMEVKIFNISLPAKISRNLKTSLETRNIKFDKEAYVKVNGNYVIAYNTPDNLKKIENALLNISTQEPDMVQLMFKFLEVKQDDLDELAFNWQYSRSGNKVHFGTNAGNALLRHYSYDASGGGKRSDGMPVGGNQDDANYYFNWSDRKNNLSFQLYALDWADNANVLYAPRITTLSDQLAKIDMSEQHYYPEDWESVDAESSDNLRFSGAVQPDLEDEQKLGINFEVQPRVVGQRITVPINIPIMQFSEWLTFDNGDEEDREYVKKPIFTKRQIKTDVTVKDGETIFVGGVVSDLSTTVHDKIPILGDIPFIGRLFQSKYTKSQKINLMVFLTCRIVKPDGSVRYPENTLDDGIPDFPRNQ